MCGEEDKALPELRNAVVGQLDDFVGHEVSRLLEAPAEFVEIALPLPGLEQPRHVLQHADLRSDGTHEPEELTHKAVATIPTAAILRQAREALARRAAGNQIERFPLPQPQRAKDPLG